MQDQGKGWLFRMKELGVKSPDLKRGSKDFRKPIRFDQVQDYESKKPSPQPRPSRTIKALGSELDA